MKNVTIKRMSDKAFNLALSQLAESCDSGARIDLVKKVMHQSLLILDARSELNRLKTNFDQAADPEQIEG
jgi:hypothetical protein